MWNEMLALLREYMGTGLSILGVVVALIYLWRMEKRKEFRIIFIYIPMVLFLIYFNPWFADMMRAEAGDEGYYRILWLVPFTMVMAYGIVHAYGKISAKKRSIFALGMAVVIGLCGSYVYQNSNFTKAENIYHVPECVVNICDAIMVPGREVMAVFPKELLQYVRQYSPVTCMPYGQNMPEGEVTGNARLYEMMEAEVINLRKLVPLTRESACHYIVLPAQKEIIGNPDEYGWIWFGETDGYAIYRDTAVELKVP